MNNNRFLTRGFAVGSVLLWFLSAYFWAYGLVAGFAIIGVLAVLLQVMAINSAFREGVIIGKSE